MPQKSFKHFFLESVLNFLWGQWSALGVSGGGVRPEDHWLIDPEAMLVFSIQMARYEPRVFDEILDWLVINGKWIDIQRMRSILKGKSEGTQRLVCAAANYISHESPIYKRKWEALSSLKRSAKDTKEEGLFLTKDGATFPESKARNTIFLEYGFVRDAFVLRKMTRSVNIAGTANLRFLLRSLVGSGGRSECLAYLLTHEVGYPAEMSEEIGLSVKGVRDTLNDLSESGLVLIRPKGKRKIEYWLSKKRWFEFITGQNIEEVKTPVWLNWIALFRALEGIWEVLREVERTESSYMRSSKLRGAMETISVEFTKSGLELPPSPGPDVKPDKYEQEFQNFIARVLGVEREPD